jgi:hypothetical protein
MLLSGKNKNIYYFVNLNRKVKAMTEQELSNGEFKPIAKIGVDFEGMQNLARTAVRNGTEQAFVDVALQWMKAANDKINELQEEIEVMKMKGNNGK